MKKIRITRGGCGICYTDANGVKRHALKTPESGAFECSDEQADRLVRLGVAIYAGTAGKPAQQADAGFASAFGSVYGSANGKAGAGDRKMF